MRHAISYPNSVSDTGQKAAAIEENALLGNQLRVTEQELKELRAANTSLQSTISELKESKAAAKVEPKAPAAMEDALLIFEATAGLKDPGAALLASHHPATAVAAATEEEDDAWGWKDDDDKPATAAAVAPTVGTVKVEAHMPPPPPPSPVKAAPAPFSASELQSNMAQLLLKEGATEEELDRLEGAFA